MFPKMRHSRRYFDSRQRSSRWTRQRVQSLQVYFVDCLNDFKVLFRWRYWHKSGPKGVRDFYEIRRRAEADPARPGWSSTGYELMNAAEWNCLWFLWIFSFHKKIMQNVNSIIILYVNFRIFWWLNKSLVGLYKWSYLHSMNSIFALDYNVCWTFYFWFDRKLVLL